MQQRRHGAAKNKQGIKVYIYEKMKMRHLTQTRHPALRSNFSFVIHQDWGTKGTTCVYRPPARRGGLTSTTTPRKGCGPGTWDLVNLWLGGPQPRRGSQARRARVTGSAWLCQNRARTWAHLQNSSRWSDPVPIRQHAGFCSDLQRGPRAGAFGPTAVGGVPDPP